MGYASESEWKTIIVTDVCVFSTSTNLISSLMQMWLFLFNNVFLLTIKYFYFILICLTS